VLPVLTWFDIRDERIFLTGFNLLDQLKIKKTEAIRLWILDCSSAVDAEREEYVQAAAATLSPTGTMICVTKFSDSANWMRIMTSAKLEVESEPLVMISKHLKKTR
jgi:hypothetical protein